MVTEPWPITEHDTEALDSLRPWGLSPVVSDVTKVNSQVAEILQVDEFLPYDLYLRNGTIVAIGMLR